MVAARDISIFLKEKSLGLGEMRQAKCDMFKSWTCLWFVHWLIS